MTWLERRSMRLQTRFQKQVRKRIAKDKRDVGEIIYQLSEANNESFMNIVEQANQTEEVIQQLVSMQDRRSLVLGTRTNFYSDN